MKIYLVLAFVLILAYQNCSQINVVALNQGQTQSRVTGIEVEVLNTFNPMNPSFRRIESQSNGSLYLYTRAGTNQTTLAVSRDEGDTFITRTTAQNSNVSPYVLIVKDDIIYAVSDFSVYTSDDGDTYTQIIQNLPHTGISSYSFNHLYIQPNRDIYIPTYRRILKYKPNAAGTYQSQPDITFPNHTPDFYYGQIEILQESQTGFEALANANEFVPNGGSYQYKMTVTPSNVTFSQVQVSNPIETFQAAVVIRILNRYLYLVGNNLWTNNSNFDDPIQGFGLGYYAQTMTKDSEDIIYAGGDSRLDISLDKGQTFSNILPSTICDNNPGTVVDIHDSKWGEVFALVICSSPDNLNTPKFLRLNKIRQ